MDINSFNIMANPTRILVPLTFACLFLVQSGCSSSSYTHSIPSSLAQQIDHSLTFPQVREAPEDFTGKVVILGGQILDAKRLKDSTELTVLQLPLDNDEEPAYELTQSQGRFIAEQEEFLDPATVPPGTRVTLVGELTGSVARTLDETSYTYPTLKIKHLKAWPDYASDRGRYGYYNRYPYYPYPFMYPYPYWRPYGRFAPFYPWWYW